MITSREFKIKSFNVDLGSKLTVRHVDLSGQPIDVPVQAIISCYNTSKGNLKEDHFILYFVNKNRTRVDSNPDQYDNFTHSLSPILDAGMIVPSEQFSWYVNILRDEKSLYAYADMNNPKRNKIHTEVEEPGQREALIEHVNHFLQELGRLEGLIQSSINGRVIRIAWRRLAFTMLHQAQTQWCWAAVAASVSSFFNSLTTWTQCSIVNAELGRNDCCNNGSSANCNRPWYLDRALTRTGNFQSVQARSGTFNEVVTEIDAGRPLCIRIGWSGGGGHFIAVDGYDHEQDLVGVEDPWYGSSDVDYTVLQTAYQGTGTWTHTYWVHA
nr:papain-like cysteine protease family protein [Candidatus Sigynarchaeota archaeon]